jgi:hypothetical protein
MVPTKQMFIRDMYLKNLQCEIAKHIREEILIYYAVPNQKIR